jgi:hypothetical protein
MRAEVKAIKLYRQDLETDEMLWEIYYDGYDEEVTQCPYVWRTHAVDELDTWLQFNKWVEEQWKGKPNNVIWL